MKSLLAIIVAACFVAGCGSSSSSAESTGAAPNTPSATTQKEPAPGLKDIVLTDEEDGKTSKDVFKADTAMIHLYFGLEKVPSGDKIRGEWICEKSAGIEPNFKIAEKTLDIGALVNSGHLSLSKPNKGWPIGDYRVDLFWNDKPLDPVKFKIEK